MMTIGGREDGEESSPSSALCTCTWHWQDKLSEILEPLAWKGVYESLSDFATRKYYSRVGMQLDGA